MISWDFERVGRRQATAGGAYRNPLEGTGISREAKLAREAIQNSCDAAAANDHAVKVVFRKRSLTGKAKANFVEDLQLSQLLEGREGHLRLPESSALRTLDDPDVPLHLMYVEDFHTTGLTGEPENPDSKFFKFVFSLGDDEKAYDHLGTGGSFGFGKSVFANLSNCYSFLVYTRVNPEHSGDAAHSRFMGASFFSKHRTAEGVWTGRAWLGLAQSGESTPLYDDAADEIANRTGCLPRPLGANGTTVIILGFDADLEVLKRGIEDYWWPRLTEHDLTVEIWNGDQRQDPLGRSRGLTSAPSSKPMISPCAGQNPMLRQNFETSRIAYHIRKPELLGGLEYMRPSSWSRPYSRQPTNVSSAQTLSPLFEVRAWSSATIQ